MRLNKILFLVFLVFYFIAGLSLLITGSIAHRKASEYAEITGHSIMSGAGFIIALGVIIFVLSALGFIGAYKNRLSLLQIFIGSLLLIILLQFIAAIVGFTLRNKANTQLRERLFESLPKYAANGDATVEWDRLQRSWKCCGIDKWSDWNETRNEPPQSCCAHNDCIPDKTTGLKHYYSDGCYKVLRDLFYHHSKTIGGVSLFFFFVEILGLISAIILLRDLKNNYGSV